MDQRSRSLRVDPAPVGPRRRPVAPLVVALAIAGFVGLAVAQPWAGSPDSLARVASSPRAPGAASAPGPTGAAGPVAVGYPNPPTDADLLAAARPMSGWGVRWIVVPPWATPAGDGSGTGLRQRWRAADPEAGSSRGLGTTGVTPAVGDTVVALGVTTPEDVLPLDIRFWRLVGDGIPRRVMPVAATGPDPGSLLWRPDPVASTALGTWPAGTYRIDVLLASSIRRILVTMPAEAGPVSGATDTADPAPVELPDLRTAIAPVDGGLFVIADGKAHPVQARGVGGGESLPDERSTWLDLGLASRMAGSGRVTSTRVAAIGVVMPPGAWEPRAWLNLVAPVRAVVAAPSAVVPLGPAGIGAGREAVLVHVKGTRPFAAGVYRLTVTWVDAEGRPRDSRWYLEVVPSTPAATADSPLIAIRRPRSGGGSIEQAPGLPILTDVDRGRSPSGGCDPDRAIVGSTRLIGVLIPRGSRIAAMTLYGPDEHVRVETRTSAEAVPGLALVALPPSGLETGRYRLEVVRETGTAASTAVEDVWYDVCVG